MNSVATAAPNALLVGRILFGVLFLVAGIMKALGFPMPEAMAWLSMLIEVVGGILIIVGWQTRRMAWFLVLYLIIATGAAHRFWEYPDAQRGNQINHFLKNLALMGGAIYIALFGPGRLSADKN
jgi:putative oxidoreductase